jgi:hypothetical protein
MELLPSYLANYKKAMFLKCRVPTAVALPAIKPTLHIHFLRYIGRRMVELWRVVGNSCFHDHPNFLVAMATTNDEMLFVETLRVPVSAPEKNGQRQQCGYNLSQINNTYWVTKLHVFRRILIAGKIKNRVFNFDNQ